MNHILNAIVSAEKELGERLNNEYKNLYKNINNNRLQIIFSTLHADIISCFKAMNNRLPATKTSNRHYWAQNSRILKKAIEVSQRLEKQLKDSSYCFKIESNYLGLFNECLKFLEDSGGSEIPIGMEKIEVYYEIPIFQLGIVTETPSNPTISVSLKLIGEGSYAKVFKYKDNFYNTNFVLKRAKNELDKKELERFRLEFNTMKQLKSPYILEVYSFDEQKNEYIMEYIDITLKKYIDENNSKLTYEDRKNIGLQIIKAFEYIFNQNLLHRDISPNNILLKKYDDVLVVKISDFGLVKIPNSELTSENTEIKGSFNDYSDLSKVGFDNYATHHEIFALTRILFFVLTGKINCGKQQYDFLDKGTNGNINERYKTLDELKKAFLEYFTLNNKN
ncbi:protein kinase family protein [Helicobacter sp. MIT 11-5569]|uniref:protein kinase family protein n=1 Tax=Helicobacter sp. MIT 11-5569 TaxID=1548151 RepID=UPI00051FE5FB|nr:protein kinase family protein [Helicobacter sp. MIT 11-5569]TLD83269.1 protein kinase family protein [Helicobacter sp. MIT 11-5569]